jgi:hypothetical protein
VKQSKALILLVLLALTGCQAVVENPSTNAPTRSEGEEPKINQGQEPRDVQECEQVTEKSIRDSINDQTAAFGSGDFERAYSIASPSFQARVSLDNFIDIISGSYGPLIESSRLSYSDCFVNSFGTMAVIDVRFIESGNSVYQLQYLMVRVDDDWRVDGASNLEVVGEGS